MEVCQTFLMSSEFSDDSASVSEDIRLDSLAPQSDTRYEWIDCAKGIGVIFVVLVHSIIPVINPITQHLSSFTMPIFFVLAGLTYNNERYRNTLKFFASSRARQFLIPYTCLYCAEILLLIPLSTIISYPLTPAQLAFWFIYGAGPPNAATHLWFLPVIYFSMIIFVVIDKILRNTPSILRWIIFMSFPFLTTIIHSLFAPNLVPWRLGIVILSASFIFIGNEMRRIGGLRKWSSQSYLFDFFAFIVIACVLVFVSEVNGFTDIAVDNYGMNGWFYLCTGTLGAVLVFILSNAILSVPKFKQIILAYGNNSQEVYEIHPPFFYLVPLFLGLLGWSIADYLTFFADFWIFRFIVGISLSLIISTRIIKKNKLLSIIFKGRISIPD
jgi:fucose 4-O-acetylase-like acetyltransferase